SLCLGATVFISTDVASMPLLWVLPLAVYLLTFIIAFSRRPIPPMWTGVGLVVFAIAAGVIRIKGLSPPFGSLVGVHLVILFCAASLCHTQLAAERPDTSHLTRYYLLIALGGVLGGAFNALVAPLILNGVWEYPIAIVAAVLLIPIGTPP